MLDVNATGLSKDVCNLIVHEGGLNETDLRHSESDGRGGLLRGLLVGVVGGAILGWLLSGPLNLLHVNLVAGLAFGIFAGGLTGALAGGLFGAGLTDQGLHRLGKRLKKKGGVLVTAEIKGAQAEEAVQHIFAKYGAIVASKGTL